MVPFPISHQHLQQTVHDKEENILHPMVIVILYYFSKANCSLKFKYDELDYNWMDMDTIISTVALTY
jgi:hypothetical protein